MFIRFRSIRPRMNRNYFETGLRLAAFALVVVAVLCWSGSSRPTLAHEESLNLLGDPLKLQIKKGKEEIPAKVTVRNSSSRKIDLEFSAKLRDSEGDRQPVVKIPTDTSVERYSVTRVDLNIAKDDVIPKGDVDGPSMPLKGFLVVSDKQMNVAPGTLPVTLTEPKVLPANLGVISFEVPWLIVVVILPLLLALIPVTIASFGVIRNTVEGFSGNGDPAKPRLLSTLGTGLTLKFGDGGSWASVTVVVAAILQAFTTAALYPEERAYFSAQQMAGFILFFAVLIGFAPVMYNFIRRKQPKILAGAPVSVLPEPQVQGYVCTLLVSSTIVIWALIGQLCVAAILVAQIESTIMASVVKWLLWAILSVSALYALVYAYLSIRSVLQEKREKLEKTESKREALAIEDEAEKTSLEKELSSLGKHRAAGKRKRAEVQRLRMELKFVEKKYSTRERTLMLM